MRCRVAIGGRGRDSEGNVERADEEGEEEGEGEEEVAESGCCCCCSAAAVGTALASSPPSTSPWRWCSANCLAAARSAAARDVQMATLLLVFPPLSSLPSSLLAFAWRRERSAAPVNRFDGGVGMLMLLCTPPFRLAATEKVMCMEAAAAVDAERASAASSGGTTT